MQMWEVVSYRQPKILKKEALFFLVIKTIFKSDRLSHVPFSGRSGC